MAKDGRRIKGGQSCSDIVRTGYEWLSRPVDRYDIFIDKNQQLFLAIDNGQLKFVPSNSKSFFYRYSYAGPGTSPRNGNVVVYSQQEYPPVAVDATTPAAESCNGDQHLTLMDFPDSLLGDDMPLNPRFWYEKVFGNGVSLQSVEQTVSSIAMGCLCDKQNVGPPEQVDSGHSIQTTEMADGHKIFLPHPASEHDKVDFGAKLYEGEGRYVLKDIGENALAHGAGLINNDVLIEVNDTNIEGRGLQYLLDLLRVKVNPRLLLGIKRSLDNGKNKFIWTFFEVAISDEGQLMANVIKTVENSKDVRPWIDLHGAEYQWLGPPVDPYDIFIDKKPQLFLTIDKGQLKFTSPSSNSSFYRYSYLGGTGGPGNGNVVVYSQQEYDPSVAVDASTTPAAESCNGDQHLTLMDFPGSMLTNDVPLDPRFWYEKVFGNGVSLQSVEQTGWYLSKDKGSDAATLSKKPMELQSELS